MNKLLMILNEFPPIGGSGVQRSTKFVKYLPAVGYAPYVVTRAYSGGLRDESLLKDLPEGLHRLDLERPDWVDGTGVIGRVRRLIGTRLMVPDAEVFWYLRHRERVLAWLDAEHIDLLYSTSYPYSSHLMALYLKRRRPHVAWVADFRDEWTNNPYSRDQLLKRLRFPAERRMEKAVVAGCDYLVANTPRMLENFVADTPGVRDRSAAIPNGFDPDDFADYAPRNQGNEKFRIVYAGALYGRRRPDYVLQALAELIASADVDPARLEVEFVGNIHEDRIRRLVAGDALDAVVKVTPYMAHGSLMGHLAAANVLLLIESEVNFATGKVFEYIRMGIPIVATVPLEGEAARVVRETRTGAAVDFADVAGIRDALAASYRAWCDGRASFAPEAAIIQRYSRRVQTEALGRCLEAAQRNRDADSPHRQRR
ncbi:MAG TPA: glycosyltransferase [Thermoleophilia bacterium]|nr:glycosyltransferase [Thermoleophilia bacterium]